MQPTTNRQVYGQQQISSSLGRSTSSYHWRLWASFWGIFQILCCLLPLCICGHSQKDAQWWITQQTRPVLLFSLLQRQLWAAWNKLSNLLPLPWLSVQWIETGLPEMAFLKQETKTWFTLQNVCVCTHTERDWNGFWLQGVKMKRWDLNWWQLILLSPSVILMCSQHTYSLSYLLGDMCVLGIANIKGQLKCLSPFQSSLQWKIHMDTKKKSRLHLEYCQGITKKMVHFTWKDEKPGLHRSGPKPSLN